MKRPACLLPLLFVLPGLAQAADQASNLPAMTVTPGTISMSGGASYDLLADLEKRLPQADYERTRQFLRDVLLASVQNRSMEMQPDLAQKLFDVRSQLETEKKAEATRSFDLSLGPFVRSALRAKESGAAH